MHQGLAHTFSRQSRRAAARKAAPMLACARVSVRPCIRAITIGNALGNSIVDAAAAWSLPEPVRQLPAEQRAQFVELSNRVNADLNNQQHLDVLRRAFELKQGNVTLSANEQLDRVGNYLTLGGASTVDVAQVKDLYREHNITFDPNPVAVTYPVDLSGPRMVDAGTYDLLSIYANGNAAGPREFISRPIDQAMIGSGQLVEKFAKFADDNPVAKYALIGLDVAAGPVAYGIRAAVDQTIVGDALRTGQEKFVGYVADKLTVAGYSKAEGVSGGIGGVSLLGIGAYGFAGAMKNVGRLVDELSKAAAAADRGGLTAAGRALQKHGEREGSAFPAPTGRPQSINQQGQRIIDDILTVPGGTTVSRNHARFGEVVEIRAPDGRGVRYGADGKFIGFLEPNR